MNKTADFVPPPLDLPLEFVLDFHARENPDHPAFSYTTKDDKQSRACTYRQFVPAIHRVGQAIYSLIRDQAQGSVRAFPIVVILVKTNTVMLMTILAGLLRAGCIPFPISPRFSPNVVAHLIRGTDPVAIIIDAATKNLASQALAEYPDQPLLCELPSHAFLYSGRDDYESLPIHERKSTDISIITHSSSSSSIFPKIVSWTSATVTHHAEIKETPLHRMAGLTIGSYALELFHAVGMCTFFLMVRRGCILAVMDPADPRSIIPVDESDVFEYFERSQPDFMMTHPLTLELWEKDLKKVSVLSKSPTNFIYGGKLLNRAVGNSLVRSGVKVCTCYGGSEMGPLTILPHFQGEDWEYWTLSPQEDINFVPSDGGLLEMIIAPTGAPDFLSIKNTTWRDKPAYNPGDLFLPHPTKSNTYKIIGRSTDQILLATGETINPIYTEGEVTRHPLVSSVVMFGQGRYKPGLIIEPAANQFTSELLRDLDHQFVEDIWPTIHEINLGLPSYAYIAKNMIIVANDKKPISISPKGLPRRAVVWFDYQDEIDALYLKA